MCSVLLISASLVYGEIYISYACRADMESCQRSALYHRADNPLTNAKSKCLDMKYLLNIKPTREAD